MNENIELLNNKYLEIKNMGWVKSMRPGNSGIGYTFEQLIGKKEDDFFFPDFQGIEIKTKHKLSTSYITLFNLTPDGDYLFPIEYLKNNYGYPDKILKNEKRFNFSINNSEICMLKNHLFRIKVNYEKEKIILEIENILTRKVDSTISWSFQWIKERIYTKISYLAIIKADSKYINNVEHFHYNDIKFYKIKNFDKFLNLLDDGKIRVSFKISFFRNGKRIGQTHDHGTGFDIKPEDIPLLFEYVPIPQ